MENDVDFGDEEPLCDMFKQWLNFLDTGDKEQQMEAKFTLIMAVYSRKILFLSWEIDP
jgi:hypothetical protein